MKIMLFSLVFFALYSGSSWSDEGVEVHDMGQMLAQIKLEKKQMEIIVDKLADSGRLSQENAVKAKREIASVKDEDIEQVKTHAIALLGTRQKN